MATVEEIIARYPLLFHAAERDSWPSIQRHGLLSTSALLDLFQVSGPERQAIESEWRPESVPIQHPLHGVAVIRDQGPIKPKNLAPLLEGAAPSEWYKLLNSKCFLWATKERLCGFLNAKSYRNNVHDVLTVSTRDLFERHSERIFLTSFNTGAIGRARRRRCFNAFQSIKDFPLENRPKKVVEVAVDYHVPDIAQFTLSVEQWKGEAFQQTVWQR